MKIIIDDNKLPIAPEQILRQAGYTFITDYKSGQESFVKTFSRLDYPRFHVYIEKQNSNVIFNLHLDQKKASYPGAHAHNAEYEGENVEQEIKRLKMLIVQIIKSGITAVSENKEVKEEKKTGWLGRMFGG